MKEVKYKLINERFVNVFDKNELEKYIDEIWDIMQRSYQYLEGGFATARTKEELIEKTYMAKLVRKNGKIVAASLYKDKNGRKGIASGTDGSEEGKKAIMKIFQENIDFSRSWSEVSGKMESILLKMGGSPIPNQYAEKLIGKKIEKLDPDGYHYEREIGGKLHKKMIIGGVPKEFLK